AFAQGLQELGWTIGRNLRIDYRWGASNPDNARKYAAELAALAPDVMLASGTIALAATQQIRHTIRSCSAMSSIRSAQVLSKAWRGRAATLPVSSCLNTASAGNGWSCSKRSRRA